MGDDEILDKLVIKGAPGEKLNWAVVIGCEAAPNSNNDVPPVCSNLADGHVVTALGMVNLIS